FVIASMALILCGTLALYDYMRVVIIFAPPADAAPLDKRIADGRRSILFAHHADYAAATVVEHPSKVMKAFQRAPHFLLDARLMMAWARALDEKGETDKARYVAQRLKEFHNDQAEEFFAPCASAPAASASASAASAPAKLPFQCLAPERKLSYKDFR
ncbi:MAG: PglL family O-oligosaccharyltransferase, partial [Caldimonas sp.]